MSIQTTDSYDSLPTDMYVTRVLIKTRQILIGRNVDCEMLPLFWPPRIHRIEGRLRALKQVPEQVAEDMAEEFLIWKELQW